MNKTTSLTYEEKKQTTRQRDTKWNELSLLTSTDPGRARPRGWGWHAQRAGVAPEKNEGKK